MKYRDEFVNQEIAQKLALKIRSATQDRRVTIMEVCGTHTMSIHRHGIPSLLPENVRLISGPGCPVCVTPNEFIDRAITYSSHRDCIVTTFGDMFRVPGSYSSLAREKAEGGHVLFLYSSSDALKVSSSNPDKKVIFLGIGFETTAPTIAATVLEAKKEHLANFYLISAMKVIPETLKVLVSSPELKIDGFLLPGHLSAITGTRLYDFMPRDYGLACVVSGFEPLDILQSIYMIAEQIRTQTPRVENQYSRIVKADGNTKARRFMHEVFCVTDSNWRGIGTIPASGLKLREEFQEFDAEAMIPVSPPKSREHPGCICGQILRGLKSPPQCPLYKKVCTPENPVGACMVSSEGTCAAFYTYVGHG